VVNLNKKKVGGIFDEKLNLNGIVMQ